MLGGLARSQEYERKCVPLKHSADVRRENNGDAGPDGLPRVVHVSNVIEAPELASLAADPTLLRLASECLGCSGVRRRGFVGMSGGPVPGKFD